jgi:hypothetical protein
VALYQLIISVVLVEDACNVGIRTVVFLSSRNRPLEPKKTII